MKHGSAARLSSFSVQINLSGTGIDLILRSAAGFLLNANANKQTNAISANPIKTSATFTTYLQYVTPSLQSHPVLPGVIPKPTLPSAVMTCTVLPVIRSVILQARDTENFSQSDSLFHATHAIRAITVHIAAVITARDMRSLRSWMFISFYREQRKQLLTPALRLYNTVLLGIREPNGAALDLSV